MFTPEIVYALEKLKVAERYADLSQKYQVPTNEMFEDYDIKEVLNIFDQLGYDATYNKSESFFKIASKVDELKFQINISLKYGAAELIWCVWKEKDVLLGTPLGRIVKKISGDETKVKMPSFRNYHDLKQLLSDSLKMYGEFKELVLYAYEQK